MKRVPYRSSLPHECAPVASTFRGCSSLRLVVAVLMFVGVYSAAVAIGALAAVWNAYAVKCFLLLMLPVWPSCIALLAAFAACLTAEWRTRKTSSRGTEASFYGLLAVGLAVGSGVLILEAPWGSLNGFVGSVLAAAIVCIYFVLLTGPGMVAGVGLAHWILARTERARMARVRGQSWPYFVGTSSWSS